MQSGLVNTFQAYERGIGQQYTGAADAAKYGALAVLFRSMNLRLDDHPHTGEMSYGSLPISKTVSYTHLTLPTSDLV